MTLTVDLIQIEVFLSILLRLGLTLFMVPFFRSARYPAFIKAGTILALTLMLFPFLSTDVTPLPLGRPVLVLWITLGELVFASVFALTIHLLFCAFQVAGHMLGFQMGLGIAQVFDPTSSNQQSILSEWFQFIVSLVLFSLGGHHVILKAIVDSYHAVPIGGFQADPADFAGLTMLSARSLVIAVKVASPVMAALLLTHMGLGLVSKFSPQIHILMVSFPLTLTVGLFMAGLSFLVWERVIEAYCSEVYRYLLAVVT